MFGQFSLLFVSRIIPSCLLLFLHHITPLELFRYEKACNRSWSDGRRKQSAGLGADEEIVVKSIHRFSFNKVWRQSRQLRSVPSHSTAVCLFSPLNRKPISQPSMSVDVFVVRVVLLFIDVLSAGRLEPRTAEEPKRRERN